MTQRNVETVIGKLVADDELRELFRRDRASAIRQIQAQGLELNAVEVAALEALDPAEFERLAATLDPRLRKASLRQPGRNRNHTGAVLLALAIGAGAASPVSAAAEPEALTLDRAVAIALEANRDLLDADLQIRRDEAAVADAKTKRLPSLDLHALSGQTISNVSITVPGGSLGTYPGTGPLPGADTKITSDQGPSFYVSSTLMQPVTQLHEAGLNVKLHRTGVAIDREEKRARRVSVAAAVKETYFGILQTRSALDAAREQIALLTETQREVAELVAQEAALPAQALDAKAGLAAEELDQLRLANQDRTYRERLNDLLGRDLDTEFTVAELPEAALPESELETVRARALANRPEIRQARLKIEMAETQVRVTKAEYIPQLSLAVDYSSYYGIDLLPRNVAQAGLLLSWKPLDWGRSKRIASDNLRVAQARNDAAAAESRVSMEVGRCFRALNEAHAQLGVARLSRDAASERASVAANRRSEQANLVRDVLDARAGLAAAEANYQAALSGYWSARAELDKAVGEEL